ncbi:MULTISPECIES: hypothetical protein [Aerococcus]|uniref:Uncharacterized protein n=2 Tax=Aerococcus TaxID=1375 RepID=A0A2I1L5T4_9LACT|nr:MULTISPECIES: hypothetical protein [Aerococcus]KAA9218647.1 hypothetical protein F6I39_06440 [Aerococcus loyolae]KAA9264143.1 hypothetical protein F6I19_08050 [Aerococcus loyolae]MCY3025897.1 hypothetical protein [Aerococcus loyolae]MCY3027748.1 hypothetical protein [Aerococcus loyolae]MCY3029653.1 hypothetical protein [Aerococcus loyolae]
MTKIIQINKDNTENEKAYLKERMKQIKNFEETYKDYAISKSDFFEHSIAYYELGLMRLADEVNQFLDGKTGRGRLTLFCYNLDLDSEAVKLMKKYNIGYFKNWGDSDDLHD